MWAPLRGFMYGPRSVICVRARATGPRVSAVTFLLFNTPPTPPHPPARSPGAEGGGAPGAAAAAESSLTSP